MIMYIKNSSILEKDIEEEKVLYNPNKNAVYSLNSTASMIWDLCAEAVDAKDVVYQIKQQFQDIPNDINKDVEKTLSRLCSLGLLKSYDAKAEKRV